MEVVDDSLKFHRFIMEEYKKNLEYAMLDHDQIRNNIDVGVFSADFSEIYIYAFHTRTSRTDLKLTNFLFDKNIKRDFVYTMLPPAIVELRLYYERLRNIANKYKSNREIEYSEVLGNIYRDLHELIKAKNDKIDLGKPDCQKILENYRKIRFKLRSFDCALLLGTEYGSKSWLDESHRRIQGLFSDRIIKPPQDIDMLSDKIQEISSDKKMRDIIMKKLTEKRWRIADYQNNMIDSEHAAVDFAINSKLLSNSELMSIYTGSTKPLEVFEQHLRLNKPNFIRQPLVRPPPYFAIRMFCNNELRSLFVDDHLFLQSGIDVINDLYKRSQGEDVISEIRARLGQLSEKDRIDELGTKLMHYQLFFDISEMTGKFGDTFSNSLKSKHYFSQLVSETEEIFYTGKPEDLRDIEFVEASAAIIENQKSFEENLAIAEDKLFNSLCDLYSAYIKILEGYDFSKLSPLMKEHYDFILSIPKKETQDVR
jgi:hypothetical protein